MKRVFYQLFYSCLTISSFVFKFVQRRDATYEYFKEETVWSFDKLNTYINKKVAPVKGLETDWVFNTLTVSVF